MSNLFGGGSAKTASATPTRAMGIDFTSSQYGPPVPVIYGTNKEAGSCIWYGDFKSTAQKSKTGGKGGGGSTTTGYTYSASFQMGLCEGPIQGIGTVFSGTSTVSMSSVGAVIADGTQGQAPWSHLSGAAALGYSQTATVSVQNLSLGSSASLPDWNFEVQGLCIFGSGIVDANPRDILYDICTDPNHGINFPWLGDLTQFSNYCVATGLFLSPCYDQEQTAEDTLDDLFKYTNSAAWFSEGVLKVAPYGDVAVTGNGATYTPDVSPLFDLGTSDFIVDNPGDAPVQVTRKSPTACMNMVRVQFTDRANTYHTGVAVASIDEDIIVNGIRADDTEDVEMCAMAPVGRFIAQNLVQRAFFVRNTYEFKLGWRYCMLEPMDIVTLTDPVTGLNLTPVRITEVSEDENGTLTITAEEFPEGIGHSAIYNTQPNSGSSIDPNSDPGAVNAPYLFRMPGFLVSNDTPEIGVAVNGSNALWAAADIYLSHDGSSYYYVGTTAQPATYGDLATALPAAGADPDTTHTPTVQLYAPGELLGGSQADADNFVTMAMVDKEVISYETATLTGTEEYQIAYLRRGAYGTGNTSHAIGAPFVRLDDAIYRMPIDPSLIGTTIYIKFLSINCFGRTPRTLASETAYTYVVGTNVELPDVPPVPASFGTQGVADGVSITWNNTNPAAVGCTSIERSTASSGPWTVIAQVGPTTTGYTDHFTNGATYYYRARARGPLVSSGWSAYTSVFNSSGTNVNAIATTANIANGSGTVINPNFAYDLSGWYVTTPANFYQENGANNPNPFTTTYMVHKGTSGQTFDATINDGFVNVNPGQVVVGNIAIEAFSTNSTAFAMTTIRFYDINKTAISNYAYSTIQVGSSQPYVHTNSRLSTVAPANAAFAAVGVDYHNHTSGFINISCATLTPQVGSVDEVPDGSVYSRGVAQSGSSIVLPNANFEAPLGPQGEIPGWTSIYGSTLAYNTGTVYAGSQSLKVTSGGSNSGAQSPQFACSPGDTIFFRCRGYASSGGPATIACNFYSGNTFLSYASAATTSYGSWQNPNGQAVAPATATSFNIQLYNSTNTGTSYFDDVLVVRQINLANQVTGMFASQANLPAITFSNYGSGWNGMALSYTSTTTSATVTASAATLQAGSLAISYNASSVTVSGSAGTTKTFYLYYNDPTHSGGSVTLQAATSIITALNDNGNVYIASMSVTFPTSGSGGGSGSGGCPDENAWVLRADPEGNRTDWQVRAKDVEVGHYLRLSDGRAGRVTYSQRKSSPRIRVTSSDGHALTCSPSAPLELAAGGHGDCILARSSLGAVVRILCPVPALATGIASVEPVADGHVQHITCENACFWTGDAPAYLFAHHNMKPPPS